MKENKCHFCSHRLELTGDVCCDKPGLTIGKCPACMLIQVTDFSHVNDDYYAEAPSFPEDPGKERQRQYDWNVKRVARLKKWVPHFSGKKVLDFGCGTGGFLEQAQTVFGEISGFELNRRMCDAHRLQGWQCADSLDSVPHDVNMITLFHVLEHIPEPWTFLSGLQARFPAVDTVVVEVPNTEEALNSVFQNTAYRKNHFSLEHLWYFTMETLTHILIRAGLTIAVKSQLQRYSIGNNLGWLSFNKGGYQDVWRYFNDPRLNEAYEQVLISMNIADSLFFICRRGNVGKGVEG